MAKNTKAQLSARSIKFVYPGSTDIVTSYQVGQYTLSDADLESLIQLRKVSKEYPYRTIDCTID